MMKYIPILALVLALGACSSDSNDDGDDAIDNGGSAGVVDTNTGTGTDNAGGNTNTGTDTGTGTDTNTGAGGGDTNAGNGGNLPASNQGSVGGGRAAVWFGNNTFGSGVMVIDELENVFAYTDNGGAEGDARQETVFGPSSGQLQRFLHRDSDNPASAQSNTLVGDIPSTQTPPGGADTLAYNLVVENDGQQITNSIGGQEFTMTFATTNDVPAISLADIAGDWAATTSFGPVDANLDVEMTFSADGAVTGRTVFNESTIFDIVGTAAVASGADQYLTISFTWNGVNRAGILYRDQQDNSRLVVNTFGANTDGTSNSFSARMIRN